MEKITFLLITYILTAGIYAKNMQVCPNCKLSLISEAIQIAQNFDTIEVQKGIYKESNITITKPIHIHGETGAIIDAENKGHIIKIKSDQVIIKNLLLINSGNSDIEEFAAIYLEGVKDCIIENNRINSSTYGIYLSKSHNSRIANNQIQGFAKGEALSGNGIHLWYSENNQLINNEILGHRDGLYFEFSNKLTIRNNKSLQNIRYGMHFMFSHDTIAENNLFDKNITGVAIMYSDKIRVHKNLFLASNNRSSLGILMKEINDSTLSYNTIENSTEGIIIDSSNKNLFLNNTFQKNGIAIKLYGNSRENIFTNNNIQYNFFDMSTNTRESHNLFTHNYWDKYLGYDLDRNNLGDVPYRPVQAFIYWVHKYQELSMLLGSPVVEFLNLAEKAFPSLSPVNLMDKYPRLKRIIDDRS